MATLRVIMAALADQIRDGLAAVTDVTVQVEPRWVTNPTPPTIDMYVADPSNDPDWRSFGRIIGADLVTVRARVDISDSDASQDLLLDFMDDEHPLSIVQAIDADPTLGGLVSLDLRSRSGFVRVVESGDHMGCLWHYVVVKARS